MAVSLVIEDRPKLADVPGYSGFQLTDAISRAGDAQLGGGFMAFTADTEIANWTLLTYDEVIYVTHGTLHVAENGINHKVRTGQAVLIEAGSTVTYWGEAGTRAIYVTCPR